MSNARDKANIPALNFSSTGIDDNATSTAITIDSSEQVGIGATTPLFKLEVKDGEFAVRQTNSSSSPSVRLINDVETQAILRGAGTTRTNPGATQGMPQLISASGYDLFIGTDGNDNIPFTTNRSERMRLTSDGKLGIGTSSPSSKLHVNGNFTSTGIDDNATETTITIDSNERVKIVSGAPTQTSSTLTLKDDVASGTGAKPRLGFQDSANTYLGDIGYASGGTSDLYFYNIQNANLIFGTNNSERMRIDSSGNVGIGETSMDALLVIKGASDESTTPSIRLKDGSDSREAWITNNAGDLILTTGGNDNVPHTQLRMLNGNLMTFKTSNTERMRINSSGSVGIGTSSPGTVPLNVVSTDGGNVDDILELRNNSTTAGTGVRLRFVSSTDVSSVPNSVSISSYRNAGSDHDMLFESSGSEKMRIRSTGLIGIGTSSPSSKLHIVQDGASAACCRMNNTQSGTSSSNTVIFQRNGTNVGFIQVTGSATSYVTSSDYRIKENVSYDFDATSRLKQLKPARFNFIADADTTVDGFLAHEVSSVVPEAISGEKDAVDENGNPQYQGIDQSKLVPLLVKTIQELEARITTLEANNP